MDAGVSVRVGGGADAAASGAARKRGTASLWDTLQGIGVSIYTDCSQQIWVLNYNVEYNWRNPLLSVLWEQRCRFSGY